MTYINTALVRMLTAVSGLRDRMSEERGQDLLEYALLGGLIAAALVTAALFLQPAIVALGDGITACVDFNNITNCSPLS